MAGTAGVVQGGAMVPLLPPPNSNIENALDPIRRVGFMRDAPLPSMERGEAQLNNPALKAVGIGGKIDLFA